MEVTQVFIDGRMDEQDVVYTSMEYYLALKKEILQYATTCLNLVDIMKWASHRKTNTV